MYNQTRTRLNFALCYQKNFDPLSNCTNCYKNYNFSDLCRTCINKFSLETKEAVTNNYEIVKNFDVYEKFEQPLVKDGWDVIVFIPSEEEDKDRITCGNSLITELK